MNLNEILKMNNVAERAWLGTLSILRLIIELDTVELFWLTIRHNVVVQRNFAFKWPAM